VDDTIPPVITCPTNVIVECGSSLDPTNTGSATATDNCTTNPVIAYSDALVQSIYNYNVNFYAADPAYTPGPNQQPYARLSPASLPCPDSALLTGRAADPLRNAVCFGPTANQLAALTSLGGVPLSFGQVVPYEVVIGVTGNQGAGHGVLQFSIDWSTYTTSNNRFGFDTNYMVYCAFVDTADMGTINPNHYAKVDSYSSKLVNPGTVTEAIEGTFQVSGLDVGDQVVVEIWLVMMSTQPAHVGGTIASQIASAQSLDPNPQPVSTGSKTISLGNLGKMTPLPTPPQPQSGPPLPPPPLPVPGVTIAVVNRTWTATDDCGNVSTCVQRLIVRDTTPPVITVPPDLVLACPATDTSTNVTGTAVAQDACGSVTSLTYSDVVSNGCGGSEVISRTWSATDDSGNTTNVVQTITVRTGPTLTCPPDLVLECPADTSTNSTGVATAQDACSPAVVGYSDIVSNLCGSATITFRTWTAIDNCGNSTNCVQKITMQDTTPPTLSCQPSRTVSATDSWTFDAPTASDTCGAVTVQVLNTVTNGPNAGTLIVTRTWLATDACGNTNTCSQTITVNLGQLPIITSFTRSQIVPEGSDLTLAVAATSQTPCTYTWMLGGVPIPGASGTTCPLHKIQLTNAGVYSVIVSNTAGAVGSPAAVIDVGAKLSYLSISNRLTLSWSSPYILQAASAATGPWADVAGATSPFMPAMGLPWQFFRLRSPTIVFATNYSGGQFTMSSPGVTGCNFIFQASTNQTDWSNLQTNPSPFMFIDSNASQYPNRTYRAVTAQPIVNPPAPVPVSITAAPVGLTEMLGGGLALTVAATGSGPLAYQWQLNGVSVAGATGSSLNLNNLQFANAGLYTVVISNAAGVTSSAAAVVNVGATISQQLSGSAMQLTWPAPYVLQAAGAASGPYADLAGVNSPYSYNLASASQSFFRLRSPPFQFTSGYLPGGEFMMSGPGVPGYSFVLQATTDQVHWINLQTNSSPVSLVDSNAAQYTNRTYRAVIAH
jgi:hypothetical protein